jgi:uncharacterized protein (TIGR03435 family)
MIPETLVKAPGNALAWFLLLSSLALQAQAPATSPVPVPQLSFDVVSIRKNISGSREMKRQSAADTDDITMTNVPLAVVLFYAYWIKDENLLAGIPQWTFTERYDVVAKVASSDLPAYRALTSRQRAAMLQKILADRCQLQAHYETKDKPVYALVVAKGGPRLKQALPGEIHPNTAKADPSGFVHGATIFTTGPGQLTGEAATMADLALALSNTEAELLGRVVVDRTELTGKYDFTLQAQPSQMDASTTSGNEQQVGEQQQALFSALEQLGLKLQPATAPTEFLIVDHIERPSEN